MAYREVCFRIRTEAYVSERSSDADKAAFREESRRLFQELGWTLEPGCNGVCDTVTKDQQDLYLHPSVFSGVMEEANIPPLQEQLSKARTFHSFGFDCHEEYRDLSDEEYRAELETRRGEITAYILERCRTKRRNLYIVAPVAEHVAAKFEIHRLCDKNRHNKIGNKFVAGLMEELLQKGWLVSAQTSHGEGIRTATDLRELENDGYLVDTQLKTVYVTDGTTTEITWENTAVTGQIQITKTSEDYNSMNGWPAGTPIPNTEFEIYHYRTGNLVDTVRTDKNGVAVSKPLPLGRYKVVESKAAEFYGLDKTPIEMEIEYTGQIVKAAMTNKALYTNVSIKKTGYTEVMPGQQIRYDFSGIANNSTTALTSFYWRDTLPTQAVRLDKIVTGTYNVRGNYKIVYKTNLNGEYRTMYDNLNTQQNNVLDASPAALGLASNEYVTEFMLSFGVVPGNFRQVEAPRVYCNVVSWLTGGTQFVNQADVGGVYNGQWIMATSRWVTRVYKPAKPLPRTGY